MYTSASGYKHLFPRYVSRKKKSFGDVSQANPLAKFNYKKRVYYSHSLVIPVSLNGNLIPQMLCAV